MALASVAHAASKDSAYPTLQTIQLEWNTEKIEAIATDTYVLAYRRISVQGDSRGSILVNAQDFLAAITNAAHERTAKGRRAKTTRHVNLSLDPKEVVIGSTDNNMVTLLAVDGSFPSWRGLLDPSVGLYHEDDDTAPRVSGVGLNPAKIAQLIRAAYDLNDRPQFVFRPYGTDAALKPWLVAADDKTIGPFRGLIMPTRPPRA
jgi:hypothetical protein